jgi:hypothetical protein
MAELAATILPERAAEKSFFGRLSAPTPNTFFLLCFAFFLLWKITWCLFWGVDVSDTGWHLDSYQKIFTNPESVAYTLLYWLTDVIGGAWLTLFPSSGFLGIRILGLLVESATFLLAYSLLKNVFNPYAVAVGLVLVSFRLTFVLNHFSYNLLTVFLTVLAVFFLTRGLLKNSFPALFLAGLTLALNIFVRLPNAALFALGGLILLSAFLHHENWRETTKKVCVFGSGAVAGILAVLALMTALGHLEIFTNAIATAREIGATVGSHHETHKLLKNYWNNFLDTTCAGAVFLFLWLALAFLTPKNKLLFAGANAILFAVVLFALRKGYYIDCTAYFGFYAISIFVCAGYAATMLRKSNKNGFSDFSEAQIKRTLLTAAAAAMILLIPIGSECGIVTVRGNFEILAFPAACALIWDFAQKHQGEKIIFAGKKIPCCVPKITILLLILAFALVNTKRRSVTFFNDPGSVFSKTSVIANKHIRHIRTSERMAKNFNSLLTELSHRTASEAALMSYDSLPMLNFLTETNSYVKSQWIWVYTPKILERELRAAEIKTKQLPVIITQKIHFVVYNENSPLDPDYFSSKYRPDDPLAKERYFIFKHFIDKHKYEHHWGNEFFDVWLPKKGGGS